jgi:type II secretory pathway pseudopilin PulG
MSNRHRRRAGMTLVDVVVVIVILALMSTLILPAIQQMREQSRKSSCSHNLRTLGLAMHNYHDVYKCFPPMRLGTMGGEGEQASVLSNRYCMNGLVSLLPFYEQQRVYDRARSRNFGPVPWRNEPDTWAVQISLLLCASDNANPKTATGNSSYKFNLGTTVKDNHSVWGTPSNGVFTVMGDPAARRRSIGMRDIRDGTSNTIAMSERRIENHAEPDDVANVAINVGQANTDEPALAYEACWGTATEHFGKKYNAGQKIRTGHAPGERWADGRPYFAGFTTIIPPNGPSCLVGDAHGGPGVFTASSRHAGFVTVLLCDGSLREVTDDVETRVWMAMGTRAQGEVVREQIGKFREPARLPRLLRRFVPATTATPISNPADMSAQDEEEEITQLATERNPAQ